MGEWQPIETAPKDGSSVLLTAFDEGEMFETWVMMWGHIKKNPLFPSKTGMWMTPDGMITWNGSHNEGGPTHWKPLSEGGK